MFTMQHSSLPRRETWWKSSFLSLTPNLYLLKTYPLSETLCSFILLISNLIRSNEIIIHALSWPTFNSNTKIFHSHFIGSSSHLFFNNFHISFSKWNYLTLFSYAHPPISFLMHILLPKSNTKHFHPLTTSTSSCLIMTQIPTPSSSSTPSISIFHNPPLNTTLSFSST